MAKKLNLLAASFDEIRKFVHSQEGQDEIAGLADKLREELGSPEKWLATCKAAESEVEGFGTNTLRGMLDRANRFIDNTPPGHDPGHLHRDMLSGLALMSDPFVKKAAFLSDVIVGVLGGAFHDIGNAVTARYEDRKRKAGHGEVGGWLARELFQDLLGEATMKLLVYSIDAHTHYTKPLPVQEPQDYERLPYWYAIEYLEDAPYGLAPIIARFCDRLDLGGSSHYPRHLLAEADAVESRGENFTGEEFYEINKEHLSTLFDPDPSNNKIFLVTFISSSTLISAEVFIAETTTFSKLWSHCSFTGRDKLAALMKL